MIINLDDYRNRDEITPRCGSYQRYSSKLQDRSSIDDQLRNCRDFVQARGWSLLEDYCRSDKAISGASLFARKGLQSLIEDAKKTPRPFDCVLIDSTSRFGRNLSDVLRMSDILRHHGIFLYFIAERLDSRDPGYRLQLIMHGMKDEDFLTAHRHNVFRGMKGKVLDGYYVCAAPYGYRIERVDDGKHTRSKLVIDDEEASTVIDIYTMRAGGTGYSGIARDLNKKEVPGPNGKYWSYTSVRSILANPVYLGIVYWNSTSQTTNPETGQKYYFKTPKAQIVEVLHPELRIISDELWHAAQNISEKMKTFGRARLGGVARTQNKIVRLFSGLLKCGVCGGSIAIIGGHGAEYYGCRACRQDGTCENRLTIRRDRLEQQLLDAMIKKLQMDLVEAALTGLKAEIDELFKKDCPGSVDDESVCKIVAELNNKRANVTRAIALYGPSEGLFLELQSAEAAIKDFSLRQAQAAKATNNPPTFEGLRAFVNEKAAGLRDLLMGDRASLHQALRQLVRHLVLTPIQTERGSLYEIAGDISLFADYGDVMPSGAVEHSAKHYAFPLTLTGLQLDPRRAVRVCDSSSSGGDGTILAACTGTPTLNAANI